jgi:hypothetical protein
MSYGDKAPKVKKKGGLLQKLRNNRETTNKALGVKTPPRQRNLDKFLGLAPDNSVNQ